MYHNVRVAATVHVTVPYYVLLLLPRALILIAYVIAPAHSLSTSPMVHQLTSIMAHPPDAWPNFSNYVYHISSETVPAHMEYVFSCNTTGCYEGPRQEQTSCSNAAPVGDFTPPAAENPQSATKDSVDRFEPVDGSILFGEDITPGRHYHIPGSQGLGRCGAGWFCCHLGDRGGSAPT